MVSTLASQLTLSPTFANALLHLLSLLPLRANLLLGTMLGHLYFRIPNRHRNIIDQNIALCYPDLSDNERSQLVKHNLIETAKNMTELGMFWRRDRKSVVSLVRAEHGTEHLEQALAKNKGVIVAAPHTGAWELIGLRLTAERPMHFLYRPGRKSAFDDLIIKSRERFGGKCYPITRRGISALVKALKRGEMIGILPDQEPADEHGVFAPFFGQPAYTMTFVSNLAQKTGAPVVFAVMRRLPDNSGYHLHHFPTTDDLTDADPAVATAALNRYVEQCIAIAPDQYMWNYKRFRKGPAGTARRYR